MLVKTADDKMRCSLKELALMADAVGGLPYPDDPVRTDATVYLMLRRILMHLMTLGDGGGKCSKHDQWLVQSGSGDWFCESCASEGPHRRARQGRTP
jgi:hypothetical protein